VCSFRLAVNKQWVNREGERDEQTTWFRVTAWRKLAEVVSQYLSQGRQVMVVGEVKPPSAYLNKRGEPAASLEVTAQSIKFQGSDHGEEELEAASSTGAPVQGALLQEMDIPL
jgi:single-strand DNA-binding protein